MSDRWWSATAGGRGGWSPTARRRWAGRPVGVITDRDLALAVAADGVDVGEFAGGYASRPLVTGDVEMELEEAVALMVQHRIRRLPVTEGHELAGIVTIDDLAVR